jgi:hypothetical protein
VVFDPLSRAVSVPPSATKVNFAARAEQVFSTISGVIRNGAGAPIAGIPVNLLQGEAIKRTATTNAEGRYTFAEVVTGAYVVKPMQVQSVFTPVSRPVAVPPSVTNADFKAVPRPLPPTLRSGLVNPGTGNTNTLFTYAVLYTDPANRAPAFAKVLIDGTRFVPMVKHNPADTNFADGCVYIAKALLPVGIHNFRFVFGVGDAILRLPSGDGVVSGPVVTGEELYFISGVIKLGDSHLEGVTVTLTREGADPIVVQTNAEGRFKAPGLSAGLYTVTPSFEGYTFDPGSKDVNVGPSTTNCHFEAVLP